ncbi:hypothetical protein NC652_014650 [Populus alba x Populus x berolinensis]|nr:hypothetical protein NC652_014650 [Populus alba x Populus x berolinensis]
MEALIPEPSPINIRKYIGMVLFANAIYKR